MVEQWRRHIALIYVDVVEFEAATSASSMRPWPIGSTGFAAHNRDLLRADDRLKPGLTRAVPSCWPRASS